ncbi:hypothetical protein [Patulibacter defluvii]|uniref:hypothetical protein n=1 Tax=Patulibacter defluvii TaxID=3095358 RepID=UPI002A7521F4|nr:hypothetical protein [Patulibacter sp. DM4]
MLVAIGVAGGTAAAVALPEDRPEDARAVDAPVLRRAAARPEPSHDGAVRVRAVGGVIVAARVADPAGGPDWALWRFDGRRSYRDRGRIRPLGGPQRCTQLVRLDRGRPGWLDGVGTFRPVRPGSQATPLVCGSRRPDQGGVPTLELVRPLAGLDGPAPRIASTVLWGSVGPAARTLRVRLGDRLRPVAVGRDGVVLATVDRTAIGISPQAVVEYRGRGTVDTARRAEPVMRDEPAWARRRRSEERARRPRPGAPVQVGARAADPAGGPPFGVVVVRGPQGWCMGPVGRLVDGLVGSIDFRRGLLRVPPAEAVQCVDPTRRRQPLMWSMSGGDLGQEPEREAGASARGRIARRVLPDLTVVSGLLPRGLRTLTLRSPRDVRTVAPEAPAGAYLVVYDGRFTTGALRMEGRFADGRIQREMLRLSGL